MLAATRLIMWGFILGGPLATIGMLLFITALSKDIHSLYTSEQIERGYPKVMYKRAVACLLLGLTIILLSMMPSFLI